MVRRPIAFPVAHVGLLLEIYERARFVSGYGADYPTHMVAYCPARKAWHVWDGALRISAPYPTLEEAMKSIPGQRGY